MFRITLKNYRCFSDSTPATIDLDSGFTALIGTNNSGKSSFLRFFHEFRDLFQQLSNNLYQSGQNIQFSTNHVEDWIEFFHNGNRRDIIIEVTDLNSKQHSLSRIRLVLKRDFASRAILTSYLKISDDSYAEVTNTNGGGQFIVNGYGSWIRGYVDNFSNFTSILGGCLYVGPFRNAISEGSGNYYDIAIGTTFISQWDGWKTGSARSQNEAAQQVTDDIAHIFDFNHFEINATPDKKALQVIIKRKPYRLRELGAGLAQFIIVFGNVAIRKPTLLLVDEPELNLHPSLQIDFLTSLASYASYGVMFASHSVGLARAVSDRIFTFQKVNDCGTVKPFEQTPNYAEFIGEMSFSSFKEVGCDRVLLVEGVTEVKAIQQFLRHLRKDHTTVLLPLGGSQLIRGGVLPELNELKRISNNVAVLIDSERESETASVSKEREQFIADCQTLGFKTCVTKYRAFENYLTEDAIKAEKGDSFQALSPFQRLSEAAQGWAKGDNWRIARRMTREDVLRTDVGQFLDAL